MNPIEIKFQLALQGMSQSDIARACGVKQPSVFRVIEGLSRSRSIEYKIAEITQKPLSSLWPQWYGPDAQRRKKKPSLAVRIANAKATLQQLESLARREAA